MKSNKRGSNYKLIKAIRLEFRKIFSTTPFSFDNEIQFREKFLKQSNVVLELLNKLDPALHNNIIKQCYVDQTPTAKFKLNNVLGRKSHLFHVVFPSIWPILTSIGAFLFLSYILFVINNVNNAPMHLGLAFLFLLISVCCWFRAIIDEATYKGHHTLVVRRGLYLGFWLFIISEVMLFFGLFWAFFHSTVAPAVQVGMLIPALGIKNVPYWGVPLFNTALLICSSLSVTLAHKGMMLGSFRSVLDGLIITILLGLTFLYLQVNEYISCTYNISDGAYPSIFYMLTGLHGTHVFVGLVWLIVNFFRIINRHFTTRHYAGFLYAIWYWHFVDIIWIGVYCAVYIWLGNCVLLYNLIIGLIVYLILSYFTNG